MKLRFGRELASEPVSVGGGFCVSHVHRPFLREADLTEHRAKHPEIAFIPPEHWMLNILFGFPGPALRGPKRAVVVPAPLHKAQEVVVRDIMAVDGELGNGNLVCGKFVVPAKFLFARIANPQGGAARRNFYQAGFRARGFPRHFFRATNLFICRQPVQHVGERFGVHQAMLNGHVEHLHQMGMALFGARKGMFDGAIEFFTDARVVARYFLARRPVFGLVFRQAATDRIDAEGKESIEGRMEGPQPEGALREQVPVEGFDMAQVKNNAMPLWNGPVVQCLFLDQLEKFVGSRAGFQQAGMKIVTDADSGGSECSHGVAPFVRCQVRQKDAPKIGVGRRTTLVWSRRELGLSTEMNATSEDFFGNLIEFRQVSYHINDIPRRVVISDLSLAVPIGETLVLLGRSGSGKTTLLRLINGMLMPSQGQVLVQGRATAEWDPIRLRRGIGYVIQEAGLFPHFTVAENVGLVPSLEKWGGRRTAARVGELLRLVGLDPAEFADRRPRELSGGQRQRVGVARALAADPPILLMDEPFGALDPVTRAELQREFRALAQRLQKTIVFVTHDLREALLLASRIVLLERGKVVAVAPQEEFLRLEHPEVRAFAASLETTPEAPV